MKKVIKPSDLVVGGVYEDSMCDAGRYTIVEISGNNTYSLDWHCDPDEDLDVVYHRNETDWAFKDLVGDLIIKVNTKKKPIKSKKIILDF